MKLKMPKLVSNKYMTLLNWELIRHDRATMTKRQFMFLLSILSRKQQDMLRRQFDAANILP